MVHIVFFLISYNRRWMMTYGWLSWYGSFISGCCYMQHTFGYGKNIHNLCMNSDKTFLYLKSHFFSSDRNFGYCASRFLNNNSSLAITTQIQHIWFVKTCWSKNVHIHPWIYAFYLQQVSHLHSRLCQCQFSTTVVETKRMTVSYTVYLAKLPLKWRFNM